jgi:hypothetical protein
MTTNKWLHQGKELDELPEDKIGFVYLITNLKTGRRYIGKKLSKFSRVKYKMVTQKNGVKKRKKLRSKIDSDWQTYWSSSPEVQADVRDLGESNFIREILYFADSKGSLSYLEAREQFARCVLENPSNWYNGIIQCRIHRSHVINVPPLMLDT